MPSRTVINRSTLMMTRKYNSSDAYRKNPKRQRGKRRRDLAGASGLYEPRCNCR